MTINTNNENPAAFCPHQYYSMPDTGRQNPLEPHTTTQPTSSETPQSLSSRIQLPFASPSPAPSMPQIKPSISFGLKLTLSACLQNPKSTEKPKPPSEQALTQEVPQKSEHVSKPKKRKLDEAPSDKVPQEIKHYTRFQKRQLEMSSKTTKRRIDIKV